MTISNDFGKVATKSGRKNRLKTVGISVSAILISALIIFLGSRPLTKRHAKMVKENYLLRSETAYSNIDYTAWGFETSPEFTETFYSHRSKNTDDVGAPFEKYQGDYSVIGPMSTSQNEGLEEGDSNGSNYAYGDLHEVPIFYNVNASAKTVSMEVTQDISKAAEMTEQAVEVIIIFGKPYIYQEIIDMAPDNLSVNWYWIGTSSTVDIANLALDIQLGLAPSSINDYTTSFKDFKSNLKKAVKLGVVDSRCSIEGETLSLEDDARTYLKNNLNCKTATFSGVILTGRAENFAQLEDKDWICASNIGQGVTIQPYHALTK